MSAAKPLRRSARLAAKYGKPLVPAQAVAAEPAKAPALVKVPQPLTAAEEKECQRQLFVLVEHLVIFDITLQNRSGMWLYALIFENWAECSLALTVKPDFRNKVIGRMYDLEYSIKSKKLDELYPEECKKLFAASLALHRTLDAIKLSLNYI